MAADTITVEVAYATPEKQLIIKLGVAPGCSAGEAIERSGIIRQFPEIDLSNSRIGIFSKPCKLTEVLQSGDRVEIYRPLIADPKEVRRQRAAKTDSEI